MIAAWGGFLFSSFLGLAGSSGRTTPGFGGVFVFILLLSLAGSLLLLFRLGPAGFEAERKAIEGTVLGERAWGRGRALILDSRSGRFVVHLPPASLFREGDIIRIEGLAEPLDPNPEGSGFDEGTYWNSRGADGIFRHASAEFAGKHSFGVPRWRSLLKERLLKTMPPLMRGHLLAAWLGSRDPDLAARHSLWGTSHLLAVSGLHVGIVAVLLLMLIPSGKFRLSTASFAMWLYVLVAGSSSSAMRAGLMLQTGFAGRWVGRPLFAVNTVSVAGLLLLLWRPWFFWDLGWRLSMLAALLLSSLHDIEVRRGWMMAPLLLWVCTAGLVAGAFGSVPVSGIVVNIFAVPVYGLLLPLVSILALPALAGLPGGAAVAWVGEMLFSAWGYFADTVTLLFPWRVSSSLVLSSAGALLASYFILRGAGFQRVPAALFCGAIAAGLIVT